MEFSTCRVTLALKKALYLGLTQILDFQLWVSNMYYYCDRETVHLNRLVPVDGSSSDGILRILVCGEYFHSLSWYRWGCIGYVGAKAKGSLVLLCTSENPGVVCLLRQPCHHPCSQAAFHCSRAEGAPAAHACVFAHACS